MLISIVIPVYNSAPWLDDCLQSVLDQDLSSNELEIICVNDGSTDNSLEILNRYMAQDERVKVFSKENGGLSSALNYGLERITGEFVGLINSDDYIDAYCLDKVVDCMKNNDVDIFHGATVEVPFESIYSPNDKDGKIELIKEDSFAAPGDGGITVYKSSLIKDNNCKWDKEAGACAEWLFYDSVSQKAKNIVFSKYPTYYHRAVNTSLGKSRTLASSKKKMEALLYLASKYKNEFHYSVAYRMAVQSYLMEALSVYSNKELKENILPQLKQLGLYPYKLIWRNLKPVRTASQIKIKLTLVNIGMFLFPCKGYYLLFAKLFRGKRKVK